MAGGWIIVLSSMKSSAETWNMKMPGDKIDVKGGKMWEGLTDAGKGFEMSQDPNGMYWACLRDELGHIESGTTRTTMAEIHQWLGDHGVKSLLFEDGTPLNLATK
jgi:hypothetical protein